MIDITVILEIAIRIVAIVATVYLLPFLKAKLGEARFGFIVQIVDTAVQAAEEAARTGLIDKAGKYDYAVKFAKKFGVTFDADTIRAITDASVWEILNRFKCEAETEGAPDEVG